MIFASKWMFLLLLAVPIPFIVRVFLKGTGTVRFSTLTDLKQAGRSWRQNLLWLPWALRALALICLVVAIARPQKGTSRVIESSEGIAIEVIIDRSGSMQAEMTYDGREMNRLEVVKKVFEEFARGNKDDLKGRPNDLIGVISFARYADTICPLTLGHDTIPQFLKSIKLAETREEDGTAIGDAIALAAARLRTAEETLKKQAETDASYTIKSKIIVLLTDGKQTAGKRKAMEGADLAKQWGIKVYTIGVGKPVFVQTFLGRRKVPGADKKTLKSIAEKTGGRFFDAEDESALRNVYREIDRLETTEITSATFTDYAEQFQPVVLAVLLLLVLEILLRQFILRRVP